MSLAHSFVSLFFEGLGWPCCDVTCALVLSIVSRVLCVFIFSPFLIAHFLFMCFVIGSFFVASWVAVVVMSYVHSLSYILKKF